MAALRLMIMELGSGGGDFKMACISGGNVSVGK